MEISTIDDTRHSSECNFGTTLRKTFQDRRVCTGTIAMGLCHSGRESALNSEYSVDEWEFTRAGPGKLLRGNFQGEGNSVQTKLTGFLLKTGQGDQTEQVGQKW